MTPAIQLLLIQIMQLGALLATTSRYHVFADLYGHVSEVSVRIYEPTEDWSKENHPAPIATARAYYERNAWSWVSEEEQQQRIQRELAFMRAALHAYLPSGPAEPEEPASVEPAPDLETTLGDDSLAAIRRLALDGGIAELQLETGPLSHSVLLTVDKIDHPAGYGLEAALAIHKQRHTLVLRPTDGIYVHRLCEWIEAIAHSRLATAA